MTVNAPVRRPSAAAPRVGYVIAAVIDVVILYLVNVWPGWAAVPVLTTDAGRVVGLLNVSLVVGAVVNLVYLAGDPPWRTALGGLLTTGIGITVLVRLWQIFPFDFGTSAVNWPLFVRIGLAVAIVGAAVGMIVQIVTLGRAIVAPGSRC